MNKFRFVIGVLGPLALLVTAVTSLVFYQELINGPPWTKIAVGIVLVTGFAGSIVPVWRTFQAEEREAGLSKALAELSTTLGQIHLIPDPHQSGQSAPFDLAMKIFISNINHVNFPFRSFFARDIRDGHVYAYPLPPDEGLVSDIEDAFAEMGAVGPIILESPGGMNLDMWPKVTFNNLPINIPAHEPALRRRIAGIRFDGRCCVATVIESDGQNSGIAALIVDMPIHNRLLARFDNLLRRFGELTRRIRAERIRFRIDNFLNRSYASLVRHGNLPIDEFADNLLKIFIEEFSLTDAELWLRGMPAPRTHGGAHFDHSLDIELAGSHLGHIRMGRRNFPLTDFEKASLLIVEDGIDSYVRDLWQQSVLRRIDQHVLNKIPKTLQHFLDLVIREVVTVLDAESGIIVIDGGKIKSFFSLAEPEGGVVEKRLSNLALGYAKTRVQGPDTVNGRFYLSTLLSLSHKIFGTQVLEGSKAFSDIEADCAKRIESMIDNIIVLYRQFEGDEKRKNNSA